MQILHSDTTPSPAIANIALLLRQNAERFAGCNVFLEKKAGVYSGIRWSEFYRHILNISSNLQQLGFRKGDKMVIYSPNRLEMLELELAVMASGGVAVPIFAWFNSETANSLIRHSEATWLAVAGEVQLLRVDPALPLKKIFCFDPLNNSRFKNLQSFASLLADGNASYSLNFDAGENEVCLNMYTSGTMGVPKCVQLMHRNILSQQAGLEKILKLDENDRFLSYLPWHHSFGGIFELFSALYHGSAIYLESGYGKDPRSILENWKLVKPTVFFSVPKIYQSIFELFKADRSQEEVFFHPQLKFVFTAAASLPKNLSEEFQKRKVPVLEGWGLTETSPCCTITDPNIAREPGIVGQPIPGVTIRIADDGEIQVKGPNVMAGYFQNEEANKTAFSEDGWYCTGDIGAITPAGLKLISRKDRVFKLTNGEKVIPSDIEQVIQHKCHYVSYAMVTGGGKEYPVAILFPNKKMMDHPNYETSPEEGCFCPRNLDELGRCLRGCLHDANCGIAQKFSRVKYAMIIDDELSIEKNTLTPSLKTAPKKILEAYKAHIENLYGEKNPLNEEVYIIKLDPENTVSRKELV